MHTHQHPVQIDKTPAGPCRWKLQIAVPAERLEEERTCFLQSAAKSMDLPGFRKGKVPLEVARKHLGNSLDLEAKHHILDHILGETLRETELDILTVHGLDRDGLEIPEEGPLQFDFEVETGPAVELVPWADLDIDTQNTDPRDEQIEQAMTGLAAGHPHFDEILDQAVDETHVAEADVEFFRGEESGPSAEGLRLSPESALYGSDPDAFSKALTGAKAGGTVRVAVDFQDGFEIKEWVGTQGEAVIRIRKVVQPRPATEEELAASLTDGDLDDLKSKIRARIAMDNEAGERDRRVFSALEEIVRLKPFELPDGLVKEEIEGLVRAQAGHLQQQEGLSEEDAKKKAEESRSQAGEEAKRRLRHHFILHAIAKEEGLRVAPSELDSAFKAIGNRHGLSAADTRKAYKERDKTPELEGEILEAKTRSLVAMKISPREEAPEVAPAASGE